MNDTLAENRGRLAELLKQISDESRKLVATRAEMQKAKRVTITSTSIKQTSSSSSLSLSSSTDYVLFLMKFGKF